MDYKAEEQAFYSRLEADPLSDTAIALWHALRVISMVAGRTEGLSVPQGMLCAKAGTSPSGLKRARDQLSSKGLIAWKNRGKEKATVYTLMSVCQYGTHSGTQSEAHSGMESGTHSGTQSGPLYTTSLVNMDVDNIRDQYGTHSGTDSGTHSGTDSEAHSPWMTDDELAGRMDDLNAVLDEAARIGIPSAKSDMDTASDLVGKYSAPWVLEALRRTSLKAGSARCWAYVIGMLRNWREKGGIDGAEKPPDAADEEKRRQKEREDARSLAIIRGEYW